MVGSTFAILNRFLILILRFTQFVPRHLLDYDIMETFEALFSSAEAKMLAEFDKLLLKAVILHGLFIEVQIIINKSLELGSADNRTQNL
jgi:hypothetical protein